MPKNQRHYIVESSMFDSGNIKYDIPAMKERIKGMVKYCRACRCNGMRNQPKVLTFQIRAGVTDTAIANELSKLFGRQPIVRLQDW